MNTPKNVPRSLPRSARQTGSFQPRRSYARARASRERVDAVDRMLKNQASQQRFVRVLRTIINIICILGILGLIIYTLFFAPDPETPLGKGIKPPNIYGR